MADVIVVAVVIVLLGFALKGTLKHLKGESPCCGGGDTIRNCRKIKCTI